MTSIYIQTFGCSMNQSDSELMRGLLKEGGFEIAEKEEEADLLILNSCTVKGPTESKFLTLLDKIKTEHPEKPVIVAGCIPQTTPEKITEKYDVSLLGTSHLLDVVSVVEETLNGNNIVMLTPEQNQRLNLPKVRNNKIIEIVPISEGCLGNCSYCIVKLARGKLRSYPKKEIIKQVERAVREGVKEIWITAQDTGCYGKDIGTNLPELLKEILKIEGDFFVRVGMMNPNHVLEFLDELIEIYKDPKVFKFMHIPVQSGSDDILRLMKRKYTVAEFKEIVKRVRKEIPEMTISTDIICGFPTETEQQFKDSYYMMQEIKPDVLNISRYWARPKTQAVKLPQLEGGVIHQRSKTLTSSFAWVAFERNKIWDRWEGTILIDEKGKVAEGKQTWVGRNYAYRPVILMGNYKIGDKVKVKVVQITKHDLRAVEA